jgi:hypothetical protein
MFKIRKEGFGSLFSHLLKTEMKLNVASTGIFQGLQ